MKNYSKENYTSYKDFQLAMVEELNSTLVGHDATYQNCLVSIDNFKLETVYFNAEAKDVIKVYLGDETQLVFFLAVKSGRLVLDAKDLDYATKLYYLDDDAQDVHQREVAEAKKKLEEDLRIARIERAKREEELAKIREEKEAERKYQARIAKKLKELESMKPEKTERLFNSPTTFYEALGWMAKHAISIKASMPDYMEKWFNSRFDAEYKYVVDSRKRTSGGHPVQWGLSFRMSFNDTVSGILEKRATSSNKKVIDSVAFVWDLIENYGFQFTKKTQDIEKIRSEVPSQYLADFEKGLAM